MSNRRSRSKIARRAQRGQMLVVAIAILFVLLVIGGIFVAQIGQNIAATTRSKENQGADAFARAGIGFMDASFTLSPEGADWRPVPSAPLGPNPGFTDPDYRWLSQGFTRVFFQGGRALVRVVYDPHADDPRSQYLLLQSVGREGDLQQGLDPTVFTTNGNAPRQRRELVAYKAIGLTDYLRWMTNKDHRSVTNFIGIPAIQNTSDQNGGPAQGYADVSEVLGDPNIQPTLGSATPGIDPTGKTVLFGAPIRSNSTLQLGGEVHIYESPRGSAPNISPEYVLCSGDYVLAPNLDVNNDGVITDTDYQVFVNAPLTATYLTNPNNFLYPSASTNFSTVNGLARDGRNTPDVNGVTRSIPYLDPPIMDSYVSGSGSLRYRDLTRLSGTWMPGTPPNGNYNTGFYGWGTGTYIDNTQDQQPESTNINGGYSLRGDWTNPQANFAQHYWSGPFYRPPGVLIELMGDHARLTRNDGKLFRKPDGTPITTGGGNVVDIPFSKTARTNYTFPDGTLYALPALPNDNDTVANNPARNAATGFPGDPQSYGVSLVIMAEGNVRVKGVFGAISNSNNPGTFNPDHLGRVHLTIVSGGTAYIDGNILKGDGYYAPGALKPTLEGASTCAILAKDYVTVNTTMFMASENQGPNWTQALTNSDLSYIGVPTDTPSYDPMMSFGVDPSTYTYNGINGQGPEYLLVRHASNQDNAGGGSTAINLEINAVQNPGLFPAFSPTQYRFTGGVGLSAVQLPAPFLGFPPETYSLGLKYSGGAYVPDNSEVNPNFEQRAFPLTGHFVTVAGNPVFYPDFLIDNNETLFQSLNFLGEPNLFHFQKDTTAESFLASIANQVPPAGFSETEDYLMSGTMVVPLDIQIQALLYAQERSFFVIPGYSFNQNPNDTRTNWMLTTTRPIYDSFEQQALGGTGVVWDGKDVFPFYGEPMDVKITIDGAVTENYTASAGDQAAWVEKWGYIPTTHGSSGVAIPVQHTMNQTTNEAAEHIARGLTFTYDPALPFPYQKPNDVNLLNTLNLAGAAAAVTLRQEKALRYNFYTVGGTSTYQTLPAAPRLPVCPGLLYYGPPDSPVVP